jgi:hypothetical protein
MEYVANCLHKKSKIPPVSARGVPTMAHRKSPPSHVTSPALTQLECIEFVMNSPPRLARNQNNKDFPSPKRKHNVDSAMAKDEALSKKAAVEKLAPLSGKD